MSWTKQIKSDFVYTSKMPHNSNNKTLMASVQHDTKPAEIDLNYSSCVTHWSSRHYCRLLRPLTQKYFNVLQCRGKHLSPWQLGEHSLSYNRPSDIQTTIFMIIHSSGVSLRLLKKSLSALSAFLVSCMNGSSCTMRDGHSHLFLISYKSVKSGGVKMDWCIVAIANYWLSYQCVVHVKWSLSSDLMYGFQWEDTCTCTYMSVSLSICLSDGKVFNREL